MASTGRAKLHLLIRLAVLNDTARLTESQGSGIVKSSAKPMKTGREQSTCLPLIIRKQMSAQTATSLIPAARIASHILIIRGEHVVLDSDLAALYGVETGQLVRAMK